MPPPSKTYASGRILFSVLSVRGWVCKSVRPEYLWTPYLKNKWREFHQILVTDEFGFVDVLIRYWGQKIKGQGHSRWWSRIPCECNIFVSIRANFQQHQITYVSATIWTRRYWLGFRVERSNDISYRFIGNWQTAVTTSRSKLVHRHKAHKSTIYIIYVKTEYKNSWVPVWLIKQQAYDKIAVYKLPGCCPLWNNCG